MLISKLLNSLLARRQSRSNRPKRSIESGYAGAPLHIVSATRMSETAFWKTSHLGTSLRRADYLIPLRHTIAFENSRGLSEIYNRAVATMEDGEIAVFVHDDVVLYDFFLPFRIEEGLQHFDLIGVAGDANPPADHAGWRVRLPASGGKATDTPPAGHVQAQSGGVNHLFAAHDLISRYGPVPKRVALLDGLFLAIRVSALRRSGARFDERFRFHFYDADFCRTCAARRLTIGTWPIALGHASTGEYASPEWMEALADYRAKWGMTIPPI